MFILYVSGEYISKDLQKEHESEEASKCLCVQYSLQYVLPQSSGRPTFLRLINDMLYLDIFFVRIEVSGFLTFLQIEMSDESGGSLSTGWALRSKSPDD